MVFGRVSMLCAGLAVVALSAPAKAVTFTATELSYDNAMLNQFNLVSLGNYTTSKKVEGRVVVGGNALVTATSVGLCTLNCTGNVAAANPLAGYGALTVFGNLSGSLSSRGFATGATGGDIAVRGNTTGTYNLSSSGAFEVGGTTSSTTVANASALRVATAFSGTRTGTTPAPTTQTLAQVFPFGTAASAGFSTAALKLSQGIAALPGSPGVTTETLPTGNAVFFTAANDYIVNGKKYGVVRTTLTDLATNTNLTFSNGTNDATFVIVTGNADVLLPNLNSFASASKVIFDFVDATALRFAGAWNGSILAPLATITQMGGVIDGSVVVASMTQSQELHATNLFSGDLSGLVVPEPASIAILGLSAAAAALSRRRRG